MYKWCVSSHLCELSGGYHRLCVGALSFRQWPLDPPDGFPEAAADGLKTGDSGDNM